MYYPDCEAFTDLAEGGFFDFADAVRGELWGGRDRRTTESPPSLNVEAQI